MKNNNLYFSEIIESSLNNWIAQSWQWNKYPAHGSLVALDTLDKTFFAIVYNVRMGSTDPNRMPFTYQKTEEELLADYPHIFEFLKTTFDCLPIGYKEGNSIFHLLPPEPAKIHSFVRLMYNEEKAQFIKNFDFMPLIFNSKLLGDIDELLLAMIKDLKASGNFNESVMNNFIENFSLLSGNDYRRLKIFVRRAISLI